MENKCVICKKGKSDGAVFHKGMAAYCKDCITHAKTYKGKLTALYNGMKCSSKTRGHTPPSFTLREWHQWAKEHGYPELYRDWINRKMDSDYVPSPDRLDNAVGYTLDNIELVPWVYNNYDKAKRKDLQLYADHDWIIKDGDKHFKCYLCNVVQPAAHAVTHTLSRRKKTALCKTCKNKRNKKGRFTTLGKARRVYEALIRSSNHRKYGELPYTFESFFSWVVLRGWDNIFMAWTLSDYKLELSPTIRRINDNVGYALTNLYLTTNGGAVVNGDTPVREYLSSVHTQSICGYGYKTDADMGVLLQEHDSPVAAGKVLGESSCNISRGAKMKGRSAYGYVWFFKGDDAPDAIKTRVGAARREYDKQQRASCSITGVLDGKSCRWDTATLAAKDVGVTVDSIHNRCKSTFNKKWVYG